MDASPFVGISLYVLGGLSGACFYLPFSRVKNWAWESYWMIYAVVGLVIVPWALAAIVSPNVLPVLRQAPWPTLFWCYLFGAMWGVGGLTWGLMIRYLGVGLGLAVGCGLCASAGTLIPPLFNGDFAKLAHTDGGMATLVATLAGLIPKLFNGELVRVMQTDRGIATLVATLAGVAVALLGIVITGAAGMSKERELSDAQKKTAVAEFNFRKGILIALFSGIMSAGMAFGLGAGKTIEEAAMKTAPFTQETWKGIPVLVVVLLGGFSINFPWCVYLNVKNRTGGDYTKRGTPLLANLFFAGLAGAIWCAQVALFKVGDAKSGSCHFAGWSVLMASMLIFSTLLGIFLGEWKGVSQRTKTLLALALAALVASLAIIGYGAYLHPSG